MTITIFVAKDFIWIDRINNIFVLPAQCFMVKDHSQLPLPVNCEPNWEHYYEAVVL